MGVTLIKANSDRGKVEMRFLAHHGQAFCADSTTKPKIDAMKAWTIPPPDDHIHEAMGAILPTEKDDDSDIDCLY